MPNLLSGQSIQTADYDGPSASKMPRLDEMENFRKQFAARLDAPKFKKPLPSTILSQSSGDSSNTTSLRDSMSKEQIEALKVN